MRMLIAAAFTALLGVAAQAAGFDGSWSTRFGQLRLNESNGFVIGDYHNRGVLIGRKSGDSVLGVFVNETQDVVGAFDFTLDGDDAFTGRWTAGAGGGEWNGERISAVKPLLTNFGGHDASGDPAGLTGRWDSDFGALELQASGDVVAGFYADRGVIYGRVRDGRFAGAFTNGSDRGAVEWTPREGAFSGRWRWDADTTWRETAWNGARISSGAKRVSFLLDFFYARGEHSFNPICGPDEVDVYGGLTVLGLIETPDGRSRPLDAESNAAGRGLWARSRGAAVRLVTNRSDIDQPFGSLFCDINLPADDPRRPFGRHDVRAVTAWTVSAEVLDDPQQEVVFTLSPRLGIRGAFNSAEDDEFYRFPTLRLKLKEVMRGLGDDFAPFTRTLRSNPGKDGKRAFVRYTLRQSDVAG